MKCPITLRMDSDLLRAARRQALREGISVNKFLSRMLERSIGDLKSYHEARRSATARLRKGYYLQWTSPRTRDELHKRSEN